MTDIRKKLIEHEIIKYKELREMFEKKAEAFEFKHLTSLRILREWELKMDYKMMAMNMFAIGLDWKDLLRRQQ